MIPETITIYDAADRYKCNPATLRRAVTAGKITAYKPGKTVLLDEQEADAWFMSTIQKPLPVIGRPRGNKRGKRV